MRQGRRPSSLIELPRRQLALEQIGRDLGCPALGDQQAHHEPDELRVPAADPAVLGALGVDVVARAIVADAGIDRLGC